MTDKNNSNSSNNKDKSNNTANSNNGANTVSEESAADKFDRFEGEGVVFKAKLIGSELVMEPRGDKMCQNSIKRLKAIVKGTNSHKKRIVLKIAFTGVKVYDEKTNEILHHHEVSQISYIASDDTDTRCFGYVGDVPNKAHQFICFRTSGPAANVMSVISSLFEAVLERKNQQSEQKVAPSGMASQAISDNNNTSGQIEQASEAIVGLSPLSAIDNTIDKSSSRPQKQKATSALDELVMDYSGGSFEKQQSDDKGFLFDVDFSDTNFQSTPTNVQQQQQPSFQQQLSQQLPVRPTLPPLGRGGSLQLTQQQQRADAKFSLSNASNSLDLLDDSGIIDSSGGGPTIMPAPITIPPAPSGLMGAHHHANKQPQQHQHQQQQQHHHPSHLHNHHHHHHNRSLIYNHSSKSLSDAVLPQRQSPSFTSTVSSSLRNDSYADRYAVFNDIDSLPSIFESTSLGSVNRLDTAHHHPQSSKKDLFAEQLLFQPAQQKQQQLQQQPQSHLLQHQQGMDQDSDSMKNIFRRTNPFDDNFFA